MKKEDIRNINLFLFDMDGTLYLGNRLYDFSKELLAKIREAGKKYLFMTNNSSKSVADYIGSYYVYMEGIDAIVFTAGIGENNASFRERVLDRIKVLGVEYDKEAIKIRKKEIEVSTPESKIKVFVIPTNEELAIARDVVRLKAENE